jgi:hypothetical protein
MTAQQLEVAVDLAHDDTGHHRAVVSLVLHPGDSVVLTLSAASARQLAAALDLAAEKADQVSATIDT